MIADYITMVEDRPTMSAEYRLPCLAKFGPRSSHMLSATAGLLVNVCTNAYILFLQHCTQ